MGTEAGLKTRAHLEDCYIVDKVIESPTYFSGYTSPLSTSGNKNSSFCHVSSPPSVEFDLNEHVVSDYFILNVV